MTSDTSAAPSVPEQRGLRGFLNKGGFWRLLPVVVVYLALYLLAGWVAGFFDDGGYREADLLSSLGSVFFQLAVGLIVGAILLTVFTTVMGWNAEIFGRQRIYRSWWMWVAPVLVLLPIILRVLDIDWGGPAPSVVAFVLASGLMIGYVEELLFRGIAVKMLRAAGHREIVVAALSSLLFALSHGLNLLQGQSILIVGPTILYTFAFGVLMYLTMRRIGFIVGAMILHGLTDPTGILASGGIDQVPAAGGPSPLASLVGVLTFVLVFVGFALVLCVRGRIGEERKQGRTRA